MRLWQQLDLAVQALLILAFTIAALLANDTLSVAVVGYFTIGGWQLLSMVVQQVHGRLIRHLNFRWWYHCLMLGLLLWFVVTLITEQMLTLLFFMVFASPILAIVYFALCYREVMVKGG